MNGEERMRREGKGGECSEVGQVYLKIPVQYQRVRLDTLLLQGEVTGEGKTI